MVFRFLFFAIFLGIHSLPPLFAQEASPTGTNAVLQSQDKLYYYDLPDNVFAYKKPTPFGFLSFAVKDVSDYVKITFRKENSSAILMMSAATAALVFMDQQITDASKEAGKALGIDGNNRYKTVGHIASMPIELPYDFSSALYFIGDGWTLSSITASFLGFGLIENDARALQTASQLAEGLIAVTFSTQLLKHITGRQSPFKSTMDGGRWEFFPNQVKYHKRVPEYDAFPSGHLAATMMVVTVISENYPEYHFIKPLGYTLMCLLSFQMLNNGVHWFSDYPLALSMGYVFGQLAVGRGRQVLDKNNPEADGLSWSLAPSRVGRDGIGLGIIIGL